jgi:serine/threonine protein kinase/Tol biopolymer transport system component
VALTLGTRLGPYEVTAQIGAGGMGEVFRAIDTTLKRAVAIKVLPEPVAADTERLARFQREAEILAALNHPHIAAIYGLERSGGTTALVMELVEGPTLADRVGQGAIPDDEALPIARQIAEALEAAHDAGIIHRDLKPANIKVRTDGTVKVLDFGLAKTTEAATGPGEEANSPTITAAAMTMRGAVLGTAAYMSPEQAKGRTVDKRSDIWAFGVVLFEMLTGRRPFVVDDVTDVLAAVVRAEPDWHAVPSTTPPAVRRLLKRCLTKDAKQRLHDIADARLEISEAIASLAGNDTSLPAADATRLRDWRQRSAVPLATFAAVLALMTGWIWFRQGASMSAPDVYAAIPTPSPVGDLGGAFRFFDVSNDGRLLAYAQGSVGIMLRPLGSLGTTILSATEGATFPTFSPDGQQVAFSKNGKLFRVSVGGGAQTEVTTASVNAGLHWGEDGYLYFSSAWGTEGVWRAAVGGGRPEKLTTVRDADRENAHTWPTLLPGGKAILYTALGPSGGASDSRVVAQALGAQASSILVENAMYGRLLPSGHLLYAKDDGTLYAVRFDPATLRTSGEPVAVQAGVGTATFGGAAFVAFSATGWEVYLPRSDRPAFDFLLADRRGNVTTAAVGSDVIRRIGPWSSLGRLSPDGKQVAITARQPGSGDIWIARVEGAEPQRLTLDSAEDEFPIWSPDGRSIAYTSANTGTSRRIFIQDAQGGGKPTLVKTWPRHVHATSWSPDGRWLAVYDLTATHGFDISLVSIDGKEIVSVASGPAGEGDGAFAPNGQWLAYGSAEAGRSEVFLVSLPSMHIRRQVSTSGGAMPRWDAAGRLYYLSDGKIMVQSVDAKTGINVGAASVVFSSSATNFDLTPDGERFLLQVPNARQDHPPLLVRNNWFDDVRAKVK